MTHIRGIIRLGITKKEYFFTTNYNPTKNNLYTSILYLLCIVTIFFQYYLLDTKALK